ncbi:Hsp70 family protein [Actinoplanes sp. CA-030573]|uniref:Hsp70 family protein n=1 Tax=Actinoplanes sp. CA-030573 TaxID=3239898 RepID=UPI003D8B7167
MVEYGLGVDLGTTYTAAAVNVDGSVETVRLGGREPEMPSLVFLRDDGELLVGDAAQRRGEAEPTRLAREFKRRMGDPVPLRLAERPMAAHELTARLLQHVVESVAEGQGGPARRIVLTYPANWGPYKRELLAKAAELAGVPHAVLRTEPEAAAVRFAGTSRIAVGETIAVYDLGGGTFDAAVLRKTAGGFEVLGEPQGVEQLGGIDFDEAVLEHVRETLGDRLADIDTADPDVREALARLRRECVEAKENLSFDGETQIAVALPRLHTRVTLRRDDFEAMITPALEETVAAVRRALRSAAVEAAELRCVVLAGGSSRIPLVGLLVSRELDRPVVIDEQPELGIALGAARLSGGPGWEASPAAGPAPVVLMPPRPASPDSSASAGPAAVSPLSPAAASSAFSAAAPVSGAPPAASMNTPAGSPPHGSLPPAPVASLPVSVRPPGISLPPPPHGPAAPALSDDSARTAGSASVPPRDQFPPPSSPSDQGSARSRWRAYRWPVIGGFAAVLLTVTAVTAAAAWPREPKDAQPPGGAAPAGATSPVAQAGGAAVVWKVNTGVPAVEPPAVGGNWVLTSGRDGTIRAYRRADGTKAWERKLGAGARADTAITGGVAYAVTAAGRIVAIDAGTGKEIWHRDVGHPVAARPVADGRRVYAGGDDGMLYSYEAGAGQQRRRAFGQGKIVAPPVVRDGVVVFASGDGNLRGVSTQGAPLWKAEAGPVVDGPVTAGDSVCVAIENGTVRCVLAASGAELPGFARGGAAIEHIAGGDGVLYASAADGSVTAWNTQSGAERWRLQTQKSIPVVRGDELDVAFEDGRLAGLDALNARTLWQNPTGDRISVAPRGDGAELFVISDSGVLYALRPPAGNAATATATATTATATTPAPPPRTATTETVEPDRTHPTRRRTTRPTHRTTKPTTTPTTKPTTDPTLTTPPTTEPTTEPPTPPTAAAG